MPIKDPNGDHPYVTRLHMYMPHTNTVIFRWRDDCVPPDENANYVIMKETAFDDLVAYARAGKSEG